MTGRFIAIVGPSGVGKDSVMQALAEVAPNIRLARRVITRPAEAGGEEFDGVSAEAFETRRAAGEFALHWSAHGLQYAIPSSTDADLAQGFDVMANLSRSVLHDAQARFAQSIIIALNADRAVLAQRLQARGRETAEDIAARLARAEFALPSDLEIAHFDNSGALEDTVAQIRDYLYPADALSTP